MNEIVKTVTIPEFQLRVAERTLTHLIFESKFFDICALDGICELTGRNIEDTQDYVALRLLHCVHWSAMGPELTKLTKDKILQLLDAKVKPRSGPAPMEVSPPAGTAQSSKLGGLLNALFK